MRKISYYQTEIGLLVGIDVGNHPELHHINGKALKATFSDKWFVVEGEKDFAEYSRDNGFIHENARYVLKNTEVQGVPQIITQSEIERDGDYNWTGKYSGMQGLYELASDKRALGFIPEEVEIQSLGSLTFKNLGDPSKFKYTLHGEGWDEKKLTTIDYKSIFAPYSWAPAIISIDDIVKAMTPDVCWHLNPCSLSSPISYRLIRAYVKDHIEPLYAEITSDYDFCFTVQKRIRCEPYTSQYQTNFFKSRQRPKFASKTIEYKKVSVFEMTHSKASYQGYTVLEGFKGQSLADLAVNIDTYLRELIEAINEPIAECPKCGGLGSIDIRRLKPNERADLKLKQEVA